MTRRKKRQTGKSPTKEAAKKTRLLWLSATIILVGLVLLATSSKLPRKSPVERLPAGPDHAMAAGTESAGGSAKSSDVPATNDPELTDIDKAAGHLNHGTDLLAQGKIAEAVAQYREAVKLNPDDEDMHYNLALALARQGDRNAAKEQ